MIRPAVPSDSHSVVAMLEASHIAAGFDRVDGPTGFVVPFERSYADRLFLSHLIQARCYCDVLDIDGTPQGILMAVAFEHSFGPVWLAKETAWWIEPAHRGRHAIRMLDAYEAWARQQRCAYAGMAGMGDDPAVAALYRRRGYRVAETHFLKAL